MSSTDTPLKPLIINELTKTQFEGIAEKGENELYFVNPEFAGEKALVTDENGNIVESTVTSDEVGYLSGLLDNVQDQINNLKSRGRYLSQWNCVTGLASTTPASLPYSYKTGDYFNIGTIAGAGGTNYKPDGTTYTGTASTSVETREVSVDDTYYFDGTQWVLQINTQKTVNFSQIAGNPNDNTQLASALSGKYDTTNPAGYITGITQTMVTNALGFVPYNSTNPSGYINSSAITGKEDKTNKVTSITAQSTDTQYPSAKAVYDYHDTTKADVNDLGTLAYADAITNGDISGTINQDKITNLTTDLGNKVTKNTAITGATKCKITYDSKGLVTAGADLSASDIPNLSLSKITDITASASEINVLDGITATTTELNYCDGVTSNIQTQLNSKANDNAVVKLTGDQTISGVKTFSDNLVALGLLKGTTETGSSLTNHAISIGHQNQNHMDFYENGGYFNFYKSQTGTNTPLFEINPSWVRALNNVLVENTNPGIVFKDTVRTKGTAPSSPAYNQIKFVDLYDSYLGGFELVYNTNKSSSMQMFCSDNTSSSGITTKSFIRCKVNASGVGYTEVTAPTEDTTSSVQIDTVGARNTKLGNYAKLDGSNLQTGTGSGKIRCIKETYSNGTNWYRVWSDGWIEQGGLWTTSSGGGTTTQTFLKSFSNTNYYVCINWGASSNAGSHAYAPYWFGKTTTTVGFRNGNNAGTFTHSWYACGY